MPWGKYLNLALDFFFSLGNFYLIFAFFFSSEADSTGLDVE
jgi:hypothetical protein